MPIPVIRPKKEDVLKCIARFDEIPAVDGGLPDQKVEGYYRTFRNAIGFAQPDGEAVFSPIGDEAKPQISHLNAGFGIGWVTADPGQGVMMHVHDTNETFVVVEGTWKFEWEGEDGDDHVILKEKDIASFPPGIQRRFECVSAREGAARGTIMAVVGGDTPGVEWSPESVDVLKAEGAWPDAAE
ncbi:MAG: cupin domain-containing protein [Alphaproteobacteria bacterium]|jgi:quercetin dioxygenase-like cupin family protein